MGRRQLWHQLIPQSFKTLRTLFIQLWTRPDPPYVASEIENGCMQDGMAKDPLRTFSAMWLGSDLDRSLCQASVCYFPRFSQYKPSAGEHDVAWNLNYCHGCARGMYYTEVSAAASVQTVDTYPIHRKECDCLKFDGLPGKTFKRYYGVLLGGNWNLLVYLITSVGQHG